MWTVSLRDGKRILDHQFVSDVLKVNYSGEEYNAQFPGIVPTSLVGQIFYYREIPYRLLSIMIDRDYANPSIQTIYLELLSPPAVARHLNLSPNEYSKRFGEEMTDLAFGSGWRAD